ncbi:Pectinesterase [Zea mays]|uniref:Pectinesterase n=1 Tax=Zea mays TaxID=4577 RepID=A0A1D6E3V2_MAIZE|nr:Pectinesterase [Zea mays]
MARILVLALLTIASLLLPPVVASQQAAAKCEYRKHGVSWARELDYFAARPFLGKSFVNGYHWLTPDV